HPRHDSAVRESLVRRAAGNVLEEELRKYPRGVTVGALLKATVAPETDVERLHARRLGDWIFSDDTWQSIAARAAHELDTYHGAYPLRAGMAREELRSRLGVPAASFAAVVQGLVEDGRVVERNGSLAAPGHNVAIDTEGRPAAELMAVLRRQPLAPPSLPETMRIADMLARSKPSISFEFMAPRDESEVDVMERTVAALAGHAPDWVSVTYRVRTGEKTLELVTRIKRHYHIEAMAHLTCANTADRTRQILNWMEREGVANVLALRGDPSVS